jgi:hypothetical protein
VSIYYIYLTFYFFIIIFTNLLRFSIKSCQNTQNTYFIYIYIYIYIQRFRHAYFYKFCKILATCNHPKWSMGDHVATLMWWRWPYSHLDFFLFFFSFLIFFVSKALQLFEFLKKKQAGVLYSKYIYFFSNGDPPKNNSSQNNFYVYITSHYFFKGKKTKQNTSN